LMYFNFLIERILLQLNQKKVTGRIQLLIFTEKCMI
jgi:hypothetical protein